MNTNTQPLASEADTGNDIKPWFSDSSNSRILPFSIIPRAINSKRGLSAGANKSNEESSENEESDDDEADGDDDANDDDENSRTGSKYASLDTQVKRLLVGPASNDFGSKKFKQLSFNKHSNSVLKSSHLINDLDAPPKVSMHDLDHDLIDEAGPYNHEKDSSKDTERTNNVTTENEVNNVPGINRLDPGTFNVFNSNFFSKYSSNPIDTSNYIHSISCKSNIDFNSHLSLTASNKAVKGDKESAASGTGSQQEFSIIIYGYKESDSVQIIHYFNKFGEILEDFEILNQKKNNFSRLLRTSDASKTIPIYLGDSWIKITYSSHPSYLRALKEDRVIFNSYYLTVKPYSSDLLNQLRTGKLKAQVNYCDEAASSSTDSLFPNRSDQETRISSSANTSSNRNQSTASLPNSSSSGAISSILDNLPLLSKSRLFNAFNSESQHLFQKSSAEEPDAKKYKSSTNGNRLPIVNGKQVMLVKNKSNANKKKVIDMNSPHGVTRDDDSWLSKGLDWAFGFNSL